MFEINSKDSEKNSGNGDMNSFISYRETGSEMSLLYYNGQDISKDDCLFCFHTAFDQNGLFISGVTNKSYCSNHLKLHHQNYPNDRYYLNVRKIKKELKPKTEKMIKLEIKQETESELYDLQYDLFKYEGSLELVPKSELNEETNSTINRIIQSDSTNRKEEIQSWQQEILPCEHTIEFLQHPIDHIDLTQCSQCGLKENLWICLTCGNLGCGREQFGGIPGQSHALRHFETAGHPIAVKLGSISKNIVDVYCYSCNDEIKFPDVASYLKNFGINLDTFQKTEKSLVELQIEQNLKWEFSLEKDDGSKFPSCFGASFTGLKNLGNSCYLASVLQLLMSLPEYQRFFNQPFDKENDDLKFELIKMSNGLNSGEFSKPNEEGYQNGVSPASFKREIGSDHEEFCSRRQQDAFEFLNYLIDKIDTQVDPNLNDIFKFVEVEKFKFTSQSNGTDSLAQEVKLKTSLSENITLNLNDELDIVDPKDGKKIYKRQNFINALNAYLSPEKIEWKNTKTNEFEDVYKSTHLKSFPKYLIIAVQRIKLFNWVPEKVDIPLTLPERFDLRELQGGSEILEKNEILRAEDDDNEDEGEGKFKPNAVALSNLQEMGFSESRATKALFFTQNSETETAMNWLIEHLEDPSIDEPLDFNLSGPASLADVDESQISSLQDMGFNHQLSKKALLLNNGDLNAAVEWLFSNPNDDGVLDIQEPIIKETNKEKIEKLSKETTSSKYTLKGVICHKGTQVTSGHYVAFIKQNDGRWILFNDEKVVDVTGDEKSWLEVESNGYLYLWQQE